MRRRHKMVVAAVFGLVFVLYLIAPLLIPARAIVSLTVKVTRLPDILSEPPLWAVYKLEMRNLSPWPVTIHTIGWKIETETPWKTTPPEFDPRGDCGSLLLLGLQFAPITVNLGEVITLSPFQGLACGFSVNAPPPTFRLVLIAESVTLLYQTTTQINYIGEARR